MHKYLFFLVFFCFSSVAFAADEVEVRFGKHDGYERLVFEWPGTAPEYNLEINSDGFLLKLPEPVEFSTSQIEGADSAFIEEFQIQGNTQLFVYLNSYDNLRDVRLGNKIIFDIYGDSSAAEADEVVAPEPEKPVPQEKAESEEVSAETVKEESGQPEPSKPMVEKTKEQVTQPSETILGQAAKDADVVEPHAFVLSSTDGVRMAAYRRFDSLWILINQVGLPIEPYIEGENPEQFGEPERFEVADNTATLWKIPLQDRQSVLGEGGSLYWRLIISDGRRESRIPATRPGKEDITVADVRSGHVYFPITGVKSIVTFADPVAGDKIMAVTVDTSEVYTDKVYKFVDFDSLISPVGFAFVAKNPGLEIESSPDRITLGLEDGLALTRDADLSKLPEKPVKKTAKETEEISENRLFNFKEWQMGPENALEENQRVLLKSLLGKNNVGSAERLLTLAKLNLAHGRGVEAKGYAENALDTMPQLARAPSFLALRGVASHLAGQHDLALPDLLHPALEKYPEIDLWKAASFAHLGDWQQAIATLPQNLSALSGYPGSIKPPLLLILTEVALREGNKDIGKELLAMLESNKESLAPPHKNGLRYLKGEMFRQNGETEKAITIWTKLAHEEDPLYRTKAELALVSMGRKNETVSKKDAINRLENLRFVWRGDDLEVQVLRQLGLSEIDAERYLDGFKTLRDTVVLSANNQLNDNVTNTMMETYEELFLTDKLETISPINAVMLYEEFRELTPSGEKGDRLVARLAERLVDADLLARAVKLLAYQLDYRLEREEAVNTALRMAAIQLMDRRPDDALMTLSKAETLLKREEIKNEQLKQTDLNLLRARALSDAGDVSGALKLLENMTPPSRDIHKLEADIAWRAGRWNDAAMSLRQLVLTSEFDGDEKLTTEEAQLLLNYAIALNLSDQRMTLRNIRERHLTQMQGTEKGQLFEVITRPRQNALLADRDTVMNMINETEIFSNFLDSYKTQ